MAFTCPRCAMTSHNPSDEREGYCGNCHDWTGVAMRERNWVTDPANPIGDELWEAATGECSPFASGGIVARPSHPGDDSVPAFLSPGALVVSREVAEALGLTVEAKRLPSVQELREPMHPA